MFSAANIPCRIVTGVKTKGTLYEVGDQEIDATDLHCLVQVDGAWRIVDQYRGSQTVAKVATDDWIQISGVTKLTTVDGQAQSNRVMFTNIRIPNIRIPYSP